MIGSSTICRVCVMVQKRRTSGPAAGVDCECGGESPAAMDVDKLAARIIYIAGAAADLVLVLESFDQTYMNAQIIYTFVKCNKSS